MQLIRRATIRTHDSDGFPYPKEGVEITKRYFIEGATKQLKTEAAEQGIENYIIIEQLTDKPNEIIVILESK